MKSMDKLTTGVAYGTSAGSAGYWFLQLLDKSHALTVGGNRCAG